MAKSASISTSASEQDDGILPTSKLENVRGNDPEANANQAPFAITEKEENGNPVNHDAPPLNDDKGNLNAPKPPPVEKVSSPKGGRRKENTRKKVSTAMAKGRVARAPREATASTPTDATEKSITSSRTYHALRKSNAFTGAVIFLSWEDCLRFVDPFGGNVTEFQSFDDIQTAIEYTSFSRKRPSKVIEENPPHSSRGRKKAKTATLPPEGKNNDKGLSIQLGKANLNKQLEAIEKAWEDNFDLLKQYQDIHGNCDVSSGNGKYNSLTVWITSVYHDMHQFEQDPKGVHKVMTQERYQRLKDLGIETPQMKRDRAWEDRFQRLTRYQHDHGDCNVSANNDSDLASWVTFIQHQMRQFEHNSAPAAMTHERYERLKNLGVGVSRRAGYKNVNTSAGVDDDTWWEEMFLELAAFKEKHGHTTIPRLPPSMLQNFAAYQRKEYAKLKQGKNSKLTKERIERLNGLGFDLKTERRRRSFEMRAIQWFEYRTQHGYDPPNNYEDGLGAWVHQQRRRYRIAKLGTNTKRAISKERIEKLESLGFQWKIEKGDGSQPGTTTAAKQGSKSNASWDERYTQLLEFVEQHGHTRVPKYHPGGLGSWTQHQRQQYKKYMAGTKSLLTSDRLAKLQRAGFEFNPRRNQGLQREESCVIGIPDIDGDDKDSGDVRKPSSSNNIDNVTETRLGIL